MSTRNNSWPMRWMCHSDGCDCEVQKDRAIHVDSRNRGLSFTIFREVVYNSVRDRDVEQYRMVAGHKQHAGYRGIGTWLVGHYSAYGDALTDMYAYAEGFRTALELGTGKEKEGGGF